MKCTFPLFSFQTPTLVSSTFLMAPLPDVKEALPEPLPEEPKKNVPSVLSLLGTVSSVSYNSTDVE